MERLTKRLEDGQAVMDCAACGVSWHKKRKKDIPYCTALFCRNRLKERLAAYEDTGMEPQDIISAADMAKIACALHELNAYKELGSIEHLRDLIQSEQEGRLAEMPFVAMVEQSLKNGEMKPMGDQKHNGRYAVVYVDRNKWKSPLIDICGKPYHREEAEIRMAELAGKGGEG